MKTIYDLFRQIEEENFESHAGMLKIFIPYQIIKGMLYEKMMEDIPQRYVDRFNLNEGGDLKTGPSVWFNPDGSIRDTNFDLDGDDDADS